MKIKEISISNFKSIKLLENFGLGNINILIGSNGAGKSNFISFLILLKQIANNNLQGYIAEKAGANNFLYLGRKFSYFLSGKIVFDSNNAYEIELRPDTEDAFYFTKEITSYYSEGWHNYKSEFIGKKESSLHEMISTYKRTKQYPGIPGYVKNGLSGFEVYHFHDTGIHSPLKGTCDINDNRFLRKDGSNIAAFLFYLKEKHPFNLKKIEGVIQQIAPFFDSFALEPLRLSQEKIKLEWKEKGNDEYFNADQFSDGTIRMVALTTLLLQPEPPNIIIIDEPELGLHPAAIQQLAGLIRKASIQSQIIISTQSVTLVNQFNPEDLIIVERNDGSTTFKKLEFDEVSAWLDNYSLGEIWEKNIFGGRP